MTENKLNHDVLTILMDLAIAVVQLLISDDITGENERFSIDHLTIMNAIYVLEDQPRQMEQVFNHHMEGVL